jgi:hypothetical protein
VREGQQCDSLDQRDSEAQERDHQQQDRPRMLLDGEQAAAEHPRDVSADREEERDGAVHVRTRALASQVAGHNRARH